MAKQKQLHVWLSDADHEFLTRYAGQRGETLGVIVRRLVRVLKQPSRPSSDSLSSEAAELHAQRARTLDT